MTKRITVPISWALFQAALGGFGGPQLAPMRHLAAVLCGVRDQL